MDINNFRNRKPVCCVVWISSAGLNSTFRGQQFLSHVCFFSEGMCLRKCGALSSLAIFNCIINGIGKNILNQFGEWVL